MASDANVASISFWLFLGRALAGSSFSKYDPCYCSCSTQLLTDWPEVVVPMQLALVGPGPLLFKSCVFGAGTHRFCLCLLPAYPTVKQTVGYFLVTNWDGAVCAGAVSSGAAYLDFFTLISSGRIKTVSRLVAACSRSARKACPCSCSTSDQQIWGFKALWRNIHQMQSLKGGLSWNSCLFKYAISLETNWFGFWRRFLMRVDKKPNLT